MLKITEFTENPRQTCKLPLETRESVNFNLRFLPTQSCWYFDFTYNDITSNGNKLVLGCNILRSFKNIIPFGLAVKAEGGIEPFKLDDFATGRVGVYLLSAEEVLQVESLVYNE